MRSTTLLLVLSLFLAGPVFSRPAAPPAGLRKIPGGSVVLPYSASSTPVAVAAFFLDEAAVTNGDYLAFVSENPAWARGTAPALFVDAGYLAHWHSLETLGEQAPLKAPVTNVSWFAAKAYCAWQGARLPTLVEWEFVSRADEKRADATADPAFRERILAWYSKSTTLPLPSTQSTYKNVYGVWDLHGLVWEWVLDYSSVLSSGESRSADSLSDKMFCGAGGASAADPGDYAAFMRYALRSSVKANHTQRSLGFRCARDAR